MSMRLLFAVAAAAIALAGCSILQPPPTQRSVPPPPETGTEAPRTDPRTEPRTEPRPEIPPRINESEQLSTMIGYVQSVAAMPAEEQRRELTGANQTFSREQSSQARLKLAMLLSLPGTVIGDDGRALALLEPLSGTGVPGAPVLFRRFASLLQVQVAERVREQKRSAQLREQLDALKAMERSLMDRSQRRSR